MWRRFPSLLMLVCVFHAADAAAEVPWWKKSITIEKFQEKIPSSKEQRKAPFQDLQLRSMQQFGPDAAMETGCWKSDSAPIPWLQLPAGKALMVAGWLYYKEGWQVKVQKDQCIPGNPGQIIEGFCKSGTGTGGKTVLKAVLNKAVACPTETQCGVAGFADACLKSNAPSTITPPTTGCLVGQLPFLDSNADGKADTCVCPPETVGLDTNNDLNADVCAQLKPGMQVPPCEQLLGKDWGKFDWDGDGLVNDFDPDDDDDGVPDSKDTDGFTANAGKSVLGGANGGNLYDFCENPFALRHVFCSVDGLQTSSLTQCEGTEVCELGNCVPSESSVCKPTNVEPDPTIQGSITIAPPDETPFSMVDKCYSDSDDPPHAFVGKVHCQGAKGGAEYDAIPCPVGYSCQWDDPFAKISGICKPTPKAKQDPTDNDWDDDGIPNEKDPDADSDGDGKPNGQDDDDDGDGVPDGSDTLPCVPETEPTCSEPTDSAHPQDPISGITLYGDPLVFGTTKKGVKIIKSCTDLPPIDLPSLTFNDSCEWKDTKLLPDLTQHGCIGNSPASSTAPCDWSKGFACDWQAATDSQKGICQKKQQTPNVQCTAATATTPGVCAGKNAYTHDVNHSDECVPVLGTKMVKRWKKPTLVGSSVEGVVAFLETCAALHHCEGGVCVPEPCFNKKYNDNDPCTEDSCEPTSGFPLYLPIPVDDNNYCTLDSCVNNLGEPLIVHEKITTGVNCAGWAYCQEPANKGKPECDDTTPQVDCAKDPSNPACPQPDAGLDCQKTPQDPKCQPTIDCTKEEFQDNPACPPSEPTGGFDCALCADSTFSTNHPECGQCATTLDYCYDNDQPNKIDTKGKAVMYPGIKGKEQMAHDICVDYDLANKQYTAVLEVACGPNLTFFYSDSPCPPDTTKGCVDGACVSK